MDLFPTSDPHFVHDTASASGLSITTRRDVNGNGSFDLKETDVVVQGANGTRTETVSDFYSAGALKSKKAMTVSADQLTTTVLEDLNGDGQADRSSVTATSANGSVKTTASDFNGSTKDKAVLTRSSNGVSTTIQWDAWGRCRWRCATDLWIVWVKACCIPRRLLA